MSDSCTVELFAEDAAHEAFLVPLIKRLAAEKGTSVEIRVCSAVGGHGRAINEFVLFRKLVLSGRSVMPHLIVICIDANCKKYDHARKEIEDHTGELPRDRVVIACPDPHIERWYMADPEGFALAVGAAPPTKKRKCQRDVYKAALANTIRQAGQVALLGGLSSRRNWSSRWISFAQGETTGH